MAEEFIYYRLNGRISLIYIGSRYPESACYKGDISKGTPVCSIPQFSPDPYEKYNVSGGIGDNRTSSSFIDRILETSKRYIAFLKVLNSHYFPTNDIAHTPDLAIKNNLGEISITKNTITPLTHPGLKGKTGCFYNDKLDIVEEPPREIEDHTLETAPKVIAELWKKENRTIKNKKVRK